MANPMRELMRLAGDMPARYERVVARMDASARAEFDRFLEDALERQYDCGYVAAEMMFRTSDQ